MHIHQKIDIPVIDAFIQKFAQKYLDQRSQTEFDFASISDQALFGNIGFGTEALREIMRKNAVAIDVSREKGLNPAILTDIYRSDLGELLMTYYFEEKLTDGNRFIIPLKNITYRERNDMPGRGLDAIGYKQTQDKVEILLGEAKVSEDKNSPPSVVHTSKDSIFATQTNHRQDTPMVIQRLSEFAKRLKTADATIIGFAIICLQHNIPDKTGITYGCTLIRDHSCVNENKDFGKMKENATDFDPGTVHFSILSFSDKTISETVALFYQKVQELIGG